MSIKTLRKRIALVAVSALGVGLLSVTPAVAAPGDVTLGTGSTQVIDTFVETQAGVSATAKISVGGVIALDIAAQTQTGGANDKTFAEITGGTFTARASGGTIAGDGLSITGADDSIIEDLVATPSAVGTMTILVKLLNTSGALQYTVTVTVSDERALGETGGVAHVSGSICGASNLVGGAPVSGRAGTSSDVSPFESGSAAGRIITVPVGGQVRVDYQNSDVFTISGGLIIASLTGGGASTASITNGKVVITGRNAIDYFTLNASSVGNATIVVDTTNGDPTPTAANTIRVNIVAACASSTFVAAASFVSVEDTSVAATNNVDTSASQADTEQGFLSIVGNNAYGTAVPTGSWIVSATNGARVAIASGGAAAASTSGPSSAAVSAAGTDIRIAVAQATEGVAMSSVVTVTYEGTVVATRNFTWTGDLASITVSSVRRGNTGAANYNSFVVRTFDAAGNQIAWPDASLTITGTDQNVTAADAVATATASGEGAATNDGNFFTCGSGAKSVTKLKVKGIAGSLKEIFSPEFDASCSTSTRTFTASLDKAVYVPGDIATLTLTAKDVNGNAPFDPTSTAADDTNDTFNYVNAGVAGTAQAFGYSNLTPVVAPAAGDFYLGGVKTYQFVVGATEGDYQFTVGIAGLTNDVPKTIKYSIKASTATVTNAEVLASIVKLIASINKQIRALQKSLRR